MIGLTDKQKKIIVIILAVILGVSLIPVFIVARYDCASGDDYNYGAWAHQAIVSGAGFLKALAEAGETTIGTWKTWQGTWFDCFVFCLHPEVFSDSAYVLVPYIFVIMQIAAYLGSAHHFLKVRWKLGNYYWTVVGLLFLIFSFQLVPSQKSGMFWWVGCVHYVMPMCMALWGTVHGDRFLMWHKKSDLIWLSVISALIGGATYPAALLLPMAVGLLWLSGFVFNKDSGKDKKNLLLLIPLVLDVIGLVISIIAPGNAVRSASDISQGAEPSGGAIATIFKSIIYSVTDAIDMFIGQKTFVVILFIVICIVTVIAFNAAAGGKEFKAVFAHPLLFVVVMFLVNASMYAPRLYAGGVVSSGYYNFNFWTFCLCTIAGIIYICGYLFFVKEIKISAGKLKIACIAALLICLAVAFVGRHGVKEYTDYICLEYYLSGHADDYKEQIALQRLLMEEEGVDDVVVPEINNEQGPLMQMPIVSDSENIDNVMAAGFYGKNSCRAIPRDEWIEQYGEKYGFK